MSWLQNIQPKIPPAYSESWFRGWYRDIFLRAMAPSVDDLERRPSLHDFGARTTQEAGPNFDSSAAIQRAFNSGYPLRAHIGNYRVSTQLRGRPGMTLRGPNNGPASATAAPAMTSKAATFIFYNTDNLPPFVIDGADGASDGSLMWAWNVTIEDLYFDFNNVVTSTATEMVKIDGVYSCDFNRWTLHGVRPAYTALRLGRSNDVKFRGFRVDGNYARPECVLVDGTLGRVNLVKFYDPDLEWGNYGIRCVTGSTNRVLVDVFGLYTEALNTAVLWDAGGSGEADESRLNIFGGNIFGKDASSKGLDIRRSNAWAYGLSMGSVGAIGVDIDNATSHDNCGVLGGNLHVTVPVRDTNGWLALNSYA